MKTPLTIITFLVAAWMSAGAQGVTFVRADGLLPPATGSVPFVDCAVDMNGDFRDDVVRIGREGLFIDFQRPDGTFEQRFFPLPVHNMPRWSVCAGDLDNDGANDLLFAGDSAVSFVQALDNAQRYEESLMPGYLLSQRSTLADIDLDGWLDGFVCNDKGRSVPYRNVGSGQMQPDTTLLRTADRPGNYAAIWTDHDNDGDTDLYISKCQAGAPPGSINRTNLLYRNNGDGTYTEAAAAAGIADNAQSWTTAFEDFDNDGDLDAFVVNHDEANRLFRNNGDGTFTDVIAGSGIDATDFGAFESSAGDFNNDGFVDLFAQLQKELYLGHGDLTFTGIDVPVFPGAIADLNGDGWLDVVRLGQAWINQPGDGHWVEVGLIGLEGNRNGIGSRVELYGTWGRQVREVRSGQSYTPMSSLNVHFGLGNADQIDSLVVNWPSGIRTVLTDLPSDTLLIVAEAPCNGSSVDVSVEGSPFLCPGDTVRLAAPAGFKSYQWMSGAASAAIDVTRPGTYRVLCLDSTGCLAVSTPVIVEAKQDEMPSIFLPEGSVLCSGDNLQLVARGGIDPVWSDGTAGASSIFVSAPGTYAVTVFGVCSHAPLTSDPVLVEAIVADPPITGEVVFLPNDSVRLSAEGENCHWYDQPIGGNLLGTGPTLVAALPDTDTAFFVEQHVRFEPALQSGGKADTSGAGGLSPQGGHLVFQAYAPFLIESVRVYLPDSMPPGVRFVQLWSRDSMVAFRRFDVVPGENLLPLGFSVDTGRYVLACPQGNLFRNTGPLHYPYPLGNLGQIITSSTGEEAYYFFYDWRMRAPAIECISARTPLPVLVSELETIDIEEGVLVFPVPAAGMVHVRMLTAPGWYQQFEVRDARGQRVMAGSWESIEDHSIDLSGHPDGWYALCLAGPGGAVFRPILKISRSGN